MTLDEMITGIIYLISVFLLFMLGKVTYNKLNPRFDIKTELVEKDNFAMSLAIVGYYFGLIFSIGGILAGPSNGWINDVIDIFMYGFLAIVLLNVSIFLNNKLILPKFDNIKEIIDDQNAGTGIVEGGNHVANGLILYGALLGEGGGLLSALVFWFMGQIALVVISRFYAAMVPYDMHDEIEKDNCAVGVAFAGVIISFGNVIRIGIGDEFVSYGRNITSFLVFFAFALFLLPILRFLTDKILLPGRRLTDELVGQEKPNVGAGTIEAFSYIAASFLLGWVV